MANDELKQASETTLVSCFSETDERQGRDVCIIYPDC